jgi:ADP-heptose:LPS heptosyltransferase
VQKDLRDADRQALESAPNLRHFGDDLKDFTDTAALCDLMDIVISVDTAVVHLSGALGKPTWVLLPYVPDWRWLMDRDDSPWYASVRLFRQGSDRSWDDVLRRVSRELNISLQSDPAAHSVAM